MENDEDLYVNLTDEQSEALDELERALNWCLAADVAKRDIKNTVGCLIEEEGRGYHSHTTEGNMAEILERTRQGEQMKSFKRWCEDNGRRWMGAATYGEFEKNADDYEKYREQTIRESDKNLLAEKEI